MHTPQAFTARIVFADEHLVVIDKPSGMPSVPARTPLDPPSVIQTLAKSYGLLEAVHRLDRDTSGLLVLARTLHARVLLGRAMELRHVQKRYLAVVHGTLVRPEGIVHLPLADDPWRPPRKRIDPILGRRATSRWRQLATTQTPYGVLSLLELEPITGRSHQLRAHLAWLGAAIVGDRLYGRPAGSPDCLPTRLALHAASIGFSHPADGTPMAFSAPVEATVPYTFFDSRHTCVKRFLSPAAVGCGTG